MNTQSLFSVLVAQYNNGQYLLECVESVRAQSYSNWEIVIVDDCSTDNSEEIYKEIEGDNRIRIYRNEKNMGCGYTKRRLAELAQGEICGFLDPDDTLMPQALESHVRVHEEHPEVSIIYSGRNICDERMNILWSDLMQPIPEGETLLSTQQYFKSAAFVSYKKDYYACTEGLCTYGGGIDQDLNLKLEEVGRCWVLDEVCYNWRHTQNSVSRGTGEAKTIYWNLKILRDACQRRGIDPMPYEMSRLKVAFSEYREYGRRDVYRTADFKIGFALMKPYYVVKHFIRNHIKNHNNE